MHCAAPHAQSGRFQCGRLDLTFAPFLQSPLRTVPDPYFRSCRQVLLQGMSFPPPTPQLPGIVGRGSPLVLPQSPVQLHPALCPEFEWLPLRAQEVGYELFESVVTALESSAAECHVTLGRSSCARRAAHTNGL